MFFYTYQLDEFIQRYSPKTSYDLIFDTANDKYIDNYMTYIRLTKSINTIPTNVLNSFKNKLINTKKVSNLSDEHILNVKYFLNDNQSLLKELRQILGNSKDSISLFKAYIETFDGDLPIKEIEDKINFYISNRNFQEVVFNAKDSFLSILLNYSDKQYINKITPYLENTLNNYLNNFFTKDISKNYYYLIMSLIKIKPSLLVDKAQAITKNINNLLKMDIRISNWYWLVLALYNLSKLAKNVYISHSNLSVFTKSLNERTKEFPLSENIYILNLINILEINDKNIINIIKKQLQVDDSLQNLNINQLMLLNLVLENNNITDFKNKINKIIKSKLNQIDELSKKYYSYLLNPVFPSFSQFFSTFPYLLYYV
ncbi:hypothetical protein GE118_03990 [Mycoplasma sp. NEAQ87857]|uniref:hypothetical protein n=1 Tax=Mycoplasma sp. NEAQ87857 TaxID=2683967 RepID=UPI001318F1E7|nr:hypothetical protein [Mycoplasma sp. NEAQ87857]QGZ97937.1 hypothetical protein GE118_03990 [Mycoplasma sp. NEAQ87857]